VCREKEPFDFCSNIWLQHAAQLKKKGRRGIVRDRITILRSAHAQTQLLERVVALFISGRLRFPLPAKGDPCGWGLASSTIREFLKRFSFIDDRISSRRMERQRNKKKLVICSKGKP
jgi:hypothetical protein